MPNIEKIRSLVYYAVDLCTPRALSKEPKYKTLAKIKLLPFADLGLTGDDVSDMWQTINAYLPTANYGGKAVSETDAKKCKTPGDVWDAVCKASDISPIPAP